MRQTPGRPGFSSCVCRHSKLCPHTQAAGVALCGAAGRQVQYRKFIIYCRCTQGQEQQDARKACWCGCRRQNTLIKGKLNDSAAQSMVGQLGKRRFEQKSGRCFITEFKQRQPRQNTQKNTCRPAQCICMHPNIFPLICCCNKATLNFSIPHFPSLCHAFVCIHTAGIPVYRYLSNRYAVCCTGRACVSYTCICMCLPQKRKLAKPGLRFAACTCQKEI